MEKRKPITAAMKLAVLSTHGKALCYHCQQFYVIGCVQFDHVQALVDNGAHDISNIRPICLGCHKKKALSNTSETANQNDLPEREKRTQQS